MALDVTDATFEQEVVERSKTTPVVVDLWAPWCGPCRTLGPILEQVVGETDGEVVLVKVNVDENPEIATAFRAQSIPAVYALKDGQVVDGFIGAYPEDVVRQFVGGLAPTAEEQELAGLVAAGDEASLRRALELEPGFEPAVTALAGVLIDDGRSDEALAVLARIPESPEVRQLAARARMGEVPTDGYDDKLDALLERVKDDEDARKEYLDLLELMGPADARTADYRRKLASRLY